MLMEALEEAVGRGTKDTLTAGGGGGYPAAGSEQKVDYSGKLAEAQASGDFAAVAYYTRLAQEAAKND